jgi:hypothetical protein
MYNNSELRMHIKWFMWELLAPHFSFSYQPYISREIISTILGVYSWNYMKLLQCTNINWGFFSDGIIARCP